VKKKAEGLTTCAARALKTKNTNTEIGWSVGRRQRRLRLNRRSPRAWFSEKDFTRAPLPPKCFMNRGIREPKRMGGGWGETGTGRTV
jgi:hypothetical protein